MISTCSYSLVVDEVGISSTNRPICEAKLGYEGMIGAVVPAKCEWWQVLASQSSMIRLGYKEDQGINYRF